MLKKIILSLCLLDILGGVQAQIYSTLHIYRPKKVVGGSLPASVIVNGNVIELIKNNSKIEYKLFTQGQSTLGIEADKPGGAANRSTLQFKSEKAQNYYFQVTPVMEIEKQYFELIALDGPFPEKKTKKMIVKQLSELVVFKSSANHPISDWNFESFSEHLSNPDNLKPYEGVYQSIDQKLTYTLGLVQSKNGYELIYFKGAEGSSWRPSDIKAKLKETKQPGIYEATFFNLSKVKLDHFVASFEDGKLNFVEPNGDTFSFKKQ